MITMILITDFECGGAPGEDDFKFFKQILVFLQYVTRREICGWVSYYNLRVIILGK